MSAWLFALVALGPSAAAESEARLRWSAPAQCPESAAVETEIEALSGMTLADVEAISVDAVVEQGEDGGYRLSLRIETDTGAQTRTLQSPDCEALVGVAATLVAVTMQAWAPEPAPAHAPAPEPEPAWRGFAGFSMGPGLGALPGVAAVGSLALGARTRRLSLDAEGNVWLPRSTRLADASGTILLWSIGTRVCGLPSVRGVAFPLCVGAEGGLLHGSAEGVANARRASLPWFAASTRAGVRVPLTGRLSLRADLGLLIPILRPGFSIDGVGVLHRATPVVGTGGLGLEVNFP